MNILKKPARDECGLFKYYYICVHIVFIISPHRAIEACFITRKLFSMFQVI